MSRHRPKGYGRADDWPMNPALKNLIRDVPELVDAFRALDREAVTNPHARALLSGFIWIAEEPFAPILKNAGRWRICCSCTIAVALPRGLCTFRV